MAKCQIGAALRKSIARTNSVLKDFGDPSLVRRVCDGDVPSVIARAWQRADTRRELVKALAEESGAFDVRCSMFEKVG
jgi:urease alpha subunit